MKLNAVINRNSEKRFLSEARAKSVAQSAFLELTATRPVKVTPLAGGASSCNFLIEHPDSRKFVTRVEQFRRLSDLQEDVRIAELAQQSGIMTPFPPALTGLRAGWPVSVRRFFEGTTIEPPNVVRGGTCKLAGRSLAKLHNAQINTPRQFFYDWAQMSDGRSQITRAVQDNRLLITTALLTMAYAALEEIGHISKGATADGARIGPIHVDYKHNNILLRRNGSVVILDWEKACIGPMMFDLGLSLFHFLCAPTVGSIQSATAFLLGYRSERNLLSREVMDGPRWIGFSASVFFLTDLFIHLAIRKNDTRSIPDKVHDAYFRKYCVPTYARYLATKRPRKNKITFAG